MFQPKNQPVPSRITKTQQQQKQQQQPNKNHGPTLVLRSVTDRYCGTELCITAPVVFSHVSTHVLNRNRCRCCDRRKDGDNGASYPENSEAEPASGSRSLPSSAAIRTPLFVAVDPCYELVCGITAQKGRRVRAQSMQTVLLRTRRRDEVGRDLTRRPLTSCLPSSIAQR